MLWPSMVDFSLVPERSALLDVDLQRVFVESTPNGLAIVERVNQLAKACRAAGILVVHTRHVLRPDGSNTGVLGEIVPQVRGFLSDGLATAALHPSVLVDPRDVIVDKPRFGAYYGTDLEPILRSRGIDTVIICGIETNICCDTTAREANARDFHVLFVSDATATAGNAQASADELHKATLANIGSLFGQVLTADEVLHKLSAHKPQGVHC
jgi:ureidoacrylate peracid hydrolase